MKKIVLAMWCSFLLTTAAVAQESEAFAVIGHGNKTCLQVLADYNSAGVERIANGIWVNGYLTAENARAKVPDITQGMPQSEIERRILAHCSKFTDHSLVDAAASLVQSLR